MIAGVSVGAVADGGADSASSTGSGACPAAAVSVAVGPAVAGWAVDGAFAAAVPASAVAGGAAEGAFTSGSSAWDAFAVIAGVPALAVAGGAAAGAIAAAAVGLLSAGSVFTESMLGAGGNALKAVGLATGALSCCLHSRAGALLGGGACARVTRLGLR